MKGLEHFLEIGTAPEIILHHIPYGTEILIVKTIDSP
jgi:hypothetical protein